MKTKRNLTRETVNTLCFQAQPKFKTSKYNLVERLDLKNQYKVVCDENNICCQNLNKVKKDT